MVDTSGDVGIAFLVVFLAGASTALGAGLVFFSRFVALANARFLATALAGAGGVMLYVSFMEILPKSIEAFGETSLNETAGLPYAIGTLCFFCGILITAGLRILVHKLDPEHEAREADALPKEGDLRRTIEAAADANDELAPSADAADVELAERRSGPVPTESLPREHAAGAGAGPDEDSESEDGKGMELRERDAAKLRRMGLMTAISIGLHNLPEGLATFVATLADTKVGIALGVAIAIHNIPEGISVAIPVFYSTGSRWKAFWWAVLTGVAEPVGALLGWLVLAAFLGPATYGILFGVVGGMMVYITIQELIPMAHRHDPEDKFATKAVFAGAAVMALSLVLFGIGGSTEG